ncbi:MAG: hypothetical protein L3J24_00850 [Xanthomonadales bacterium]|nr:hypothetical protein [Xanthomonadales bacterium]
MGQADKADKAFRRIRQAGFFAGLAGAFISQQMGYHDGGLNNYFTYAAGATFGGAIGGMIRKRQGKVS